MNHEYQYPIGKFQYLEGLRREERQLLIDRIASLPSRLKEQVASMQAEQFQRPYRPGGWTGAEVIHHLADSHLNAYVRVKLALTEDNPTVKPYDENKWVQTPDVHLDLHIPVSLLEMIHIKLVAVFRGMDDADFARTYYHPDSQLTRPIDHLLQLYAWHGDHHLAHIRLIR